MTLREAQRLLLGLGPLLSLGWVTAVTLHRAPASYLPLVLLAGGVLLALVLEPLGPPPRSAARVVLAVAALAWIALCALAVSVAIMRSVGW